MTEKITLVDDQDNIIGFEEKLKTHQDALLHRAFSIFIFNSKGQMLIQQRALDKYHSGGLWANSCCSHQRESENLEQAIHRRLKEEMNFDCELKEIFTFTYKTPYENGLTEYELDHVFIGFYDSAVNPNPKETQTVKWVERTQLLTEVDLHPEQFASWFKIALPRVLDYYKKCFNVIKFRQ